MLNESLDYVGQDSAAVSAVRGGDVERYRELVERHERRVFAVAWSRLGDAALAEEATQEAFIRGYRRLWLLGDGAKFAGWISSIARHAAINLGIRHRRELDKRERWSLEQTDVPEASTSETRAPCTPEMLRQTLGELPDAHRECLVLFYLEGKSGAEAAAALGISEAAFRVRLHRARGLLREQLEAKLETSLRELRPAKSLVPAVMGAVLVSSTAKAATASATALGALVKFAPFAYLLSFLPFLFMLPGFLFSWLTIREEASNYADPEGFRARLFESGAKRCFFWLVLVMVAMLLVTRLFSVHINLRTFYGFLGVFLLFMLVNTGRLLAINRNNYAVTNFIGAVWLTTGLLGIWLGWLPAVSFVPLVMAQSLITVFASRYRPRRQDYNLFVRAVEGMLNLSEGKKIEANLNPTLTTGELFLFARFLGSRWLVNNFRRTAGGLVLRLPPVKSWQWDLAQIFAFAGWTGGSTVSLRPNGTVTVQLHSNDRKTLHWLRGDDLPSDTELETQVCAVLESAWASFRSGEVKRAERIVGQTPDATIFVQPSGRTKLRRVGEFIVVALAALVISMTVFTRLYPTALSGLKPVSITEAQVRTFLNDTAPNPDPKKFKFNSPGLALFTCLVLPPTNLFSPEGLRAMRDEVAGSEGFDSWRQSGGRAERVLITPLPRHAMAQGWLSWVDLDVRREDLGAVLRRDLRKWYSPGEWDCFLTHGESWSWVKSERFPVMRIGADALAQLRLLRAVNCLDLTDREKLILQIASVQVLSARPSPGQPPIHDWRDVRGLFFTPCWPALLDTYYSLASLEILGGLDKIDREQCIRGILRLHRGEGYFTSPDSGGYNEYHVEGDARDTIAAFESLRILGALDRVKDLDRWRFRPQRRGVAKGQVSWNDVEAWVCQQRLEKLLRERKGAPQNPVRSLRGSELAWRLICHTSSPSKRD